MKRMAWGLVFVIGLLMVIGSVNTDFMMIKALAGVVLALVAGQKGGLFA